MYVLCMYVHIIQVRYMDSRMNSMLRQKFGVKSFMLTWANTQSAVPPESLQTLDKFAQVARGNCKSSQKKKKSQI